MKDYGIEDKSKRTNYIKYSRNEIINKAFQFHSKGDFKKAAEFYQIFIDQGFKDYRVFFNYAVILTTIGKLELLTKFFALLLSSKIPNLAVGILYFLQSSLVKIFDPSS